MINDAYSILVLVSKECELYDKFEKELIIMIIYNQGSSLVELIIAKDFQHNLLNILKGNVL